MTQAALAEAIGVTQSKVSKWEDGLLQPPDDELETAAEVLGFPVSFFHYDGQMHGFGSCCLYHRKRKTLPVKTLNLLHARINVIGIAIERMLAGSAIKATLPFPQLDLDEHGTPEEIARLVRGTWRIPPLDPIPDIVHYIEAAGAIVVPCEFATDKMDALSLWPPTMAPMLFINCTSPADRQRFSVCHELGHLVMHAIPTPDAESEADRFAAEFLMPARGIAGKLTNLKLDDAVRLKRVWRTSIASLVFHAKNTGAITPRRCKTLFSEISRLGYRKTEPVKLEPDVPKTLEKLINLHLSKLDYSMDEMLELTFCRTADQFRRRYQRQRQP